MEHWDAAAYDRISEPQKRWGSAVLDRLDLAGDEVVLDAGCGTGRVTEDLVARLPQGRVIALDLSPAMVRLARRRLPEERASVVVADLGAPLPIAPALLDAVFSTAAFHWVADHATLFVRLARALRPGGRLVAQCGGAGNAASVTRIVAGLGDGRPSPWTHATAGETEAHLRAAGFTGVRCWLQQAPTEFRSREALTAFLRTVVLWPHLEGVPEAQRDGFVDLVVDRMGGHVLDNVRLNILARRGPGP